MTRHDVKTSVREVGVPMAVVLGILALTAQALGMLPKSSSEAEWRAAIIERDRQYREDRAEQMKILMQLQGDIRRIEGKLEK